MAAQKTTSASLNDWLWARAQSYGDYVGPLGNGYLTHVENGGVGYGDLLRQYATARGIAPGAIDPGNPGDDFKQWNADRALSAYGGDINKLIDASGFQDYGPDRPTYHPESGQITGNDYSGNWITEYAKVAGTFAAAIAGSGALSSALGGAGAAGAGAGAGGAGAALEAGALGGAPGYGGALSDSLGSLVSGGGWTPPIGAGAGIGPGNAADWWTQYGLSSDPTITSPGWSTNPTLGELGGEIGGGAAGGGVPPVAPGGAGSGSAASGLSQLAKYGALAQGLGGLVGGVGSLLASGQQANALNRSIDTQSGYLNMLNAQQAPYRAAGYTALGQLGDLTAGGLTSPLLRPFGPADLKTNLAPNYEFMKQQGIGAATNLLNRGGGTIAGNTLKGVTDYATDYAGTGYQNAFNNYNTNQTNIFNRLAAIAGLGQTANAQSVQGTSALGPGIGTTIGNLGTAQAAGTMGAANATTAAGNNALGWFALPSLLGNTPSGTTPNDGGMPAEPLWRIAQQRFAPDGTFLGYQGT